MTAEVSVDVTNDGEHWCGLSVLSRHRRDSCLSDEVVGGLWSKFERVSGETATRHAACRTSRPRLVEPMASSQKTHRRRPRARRGPRRTGRCASTQTHAGTWAVLTYVLPGTAGSRTRTP